MKVQVFVRLKPGVLDVQGSTLEKSLQRIGENSVSHLRIGRLIEFTVDSKDRAAARAHVDQLCRTLLANTVIEDYEISFAGKEVAHG
jgi:phosphoribosylformylglycinamidine synthase PurS subunit